MGMFDIVRFTCPRCSGYLNVQSKVGACVLQEINQDEVPVAIARDIEGKSIWCQHCECDFTVVFLPLRPKNVRMGLVRQGN